MIPGPHVRPVALSLDRSGVRCQTCRLELGLFHEGQITVSTQILERPETKDADTGPEMFHYVRKEKIAESAVMGNFVVALCGETFPVTKSPKPGSPVCPQCKEIYEAMKA
jgi:hypothetical protein